MINEKNLIVLIFGWSPLFDLVIDVDIFNYFSIEFRCLLIICWFLARNFSTLCVVSPLPTLLNNSVFLYLFYAYFRKRIFQRGYPATSNVAENQFDDNHEIGEYDAE